MEGRIVELRSGSKDASNFARGASKAGGTFLNPFRVGIQESPWLLTRCRFALSRVKRVNELYPVSGNEAPGAIGRL
ncbi:MAG: hypothetical protein ACOYM3_21140, partial [Terrimicrobiaceae bacterium]